MDAFIPPVREWFHKALGEPTPPQALGWPPIQRGKNVLILSPTGSGKTLAAFLCGINDIYARLADGDAESGVQLLYVSPLKALNNDIERNLRTPLAGIREEAEAQGTPLPPLRVAVRTGDTPTSARASMVRRPPHILITTPESLYLILTSPVAREMLRTVRALIIDEIHTLCGNKRGAHLALSVERLERLTGRPLQRIGLSATQRPLEEVARFLGGLEPAGEGGDHAPRPVTIVDAGRQKPLDLQVITPVHNLRQVPGGSIWSSVIPQVLNLIREHRTTLVFANGRRGAERCADRLNEQYAAEGENEDAPQLAALGVIDTSALSPDGVPKGIGMFGTGAPAGPFRAHHGSISKAVRLQLERDLKEGRLPALVGTSSLELGIDIGAIDLVVQLQSPKSVSRGLQRVGRSGHLVGQTSVGRIYPTHPEDLLEAAAVAGGMLCGEVEATHTPQNCLDVLAQQIVAMVSVDEWDVDELYALVRRAYPYHRLTPGVYRGVLDMLSGKYPSAAFRELRPRLAWDRVHGRLAPLPGSNLTALRNSGTIPDRGYYGVYLPDRETRLGELDEEFVFETHPGDVFALGSQTWRVVEMDEDRVIVSDAAGHIPRMPFWRGDSIYRDYELGLRLGELRQQLAERVAALPPAPEDGGDLWTNPAAETMRWLQEGFALDASSARNAIQYVQGQIESLGAISSDRTVILETFTDALGDSRLVIHSCLGGRVNSAWALVLAHAFRERLGSSLEVQSDDDGILFRFPNVDRELPLDLVSSIGPAEARERLLAELPGSALFGAHFRMNAARAMMLPGVRGNRRTPFWLQRLRAKDLLAVATKFEDFPIIAETYRDCLRDVLDVDHLQELLEGIQSGRVRVLRAETLAPSPVAAGLLFRFTETGMYGDDTPRAERQMQSLIVNRSLLAELLDEDELANLIRPEAVSQVEGELSHAAEGYQARTLDELAVFLEQAGDLTAAEAAARVVASGEGWLGELAAGSRALEIALNGQPHWIASDHYVTYRAAFGLPERPSVPLPDALLAARPDADEARLDVLRRHIRQRGPLYVGELAARYPFPAEWLQETLARLERSGEIVVGRLTAAPPPPGLAEPGRQLCDRHVLERIHQRTLILLRKEVQPVSLYQYADFLARWHHLHPQERLAGESALEQALRQLRGVAAPGLVWERDLLPGRLARYAPAELDRLCASGELVWVASGKEPRRSHVRFFFRGEGSLFLEPLSDDALAGLSEAATSAWRVLKDEGACFYADLAQGTGLDHAALSDALVELALAGLVTNDSAQALREVLSYAPTAEREPLSTLEAELSAWREARGPMRARLTPERYHRAKREAAKVAAQAVRAPARWPGRWSLVHRLGVWGRDQAPDDRALQQARQLLARHGVVTRASLEREEGPWDWAAINRQLTLMEMRGEVRRGYFVAGLPGVQYASPAALEALRRGGQPASQESPEAELTLVNACDPANVYAAGIESAELARARLAQLPGNYAVWRRGQPILTAEGGGERITTAPDAPADWIAAAMRLLMERAREARGLATGTHHLAIATWDGAPVLGGPGEPLLEALGFRREPPLMVWEGMV
ncbi:MAG: DEAD/DEAH box helicase [Chloroflexi bacterium]|nr:DEAD/DEAH box helicase [Chloroflexota bacterium]